MTLEKATSKFVGKLFFNIRDVQVHFQIVDNNFPIKEDGILGTLFLTDQEAAIYFSKHLPTKLRTGDLELQCCKHPTFDLPRRSTIKLKSPVANPELYEGYLSRIEAGPGVFMGEFLATQQNGFCKIFAINSANKEIKLNSPCPP